MKFSTAYLCSVNVVEVEINGHSSVIIDSDNQLLVLVTVVGDLEVVDAGASVSVDGLHEHGLCDRIAVVGWRARNVNLTKAG